MFPLKIAMLFMTALFLATDGLHAQGDDQRKGPGLLRSIARVNPGLPVNSRFDETKPMLSVDGKFLYFARKHHPENAGGNTDPQDIFISTTTDGIHWTAARNAGLALNTPRADNLCGIIERDKLIFFQPEGKHQGGFIIRTAQGDTERSIGPQVTNESPYLEAAFSYDGQIVLYTAKNRKNVLYRKDIDERDIYYSIRTMHGWTEPRNLGSIINSSGDEFSPFLAADGRTLYFASTGHGGFGSADVFVSRRIGEGWDLWSTPENLGPRINTSRFDGYFTISPSSRIAYMVSNANSLGKSDIITVVLPENHQPATYVQWQFMTRNSETSMPVRAHITIADDDGKKIASGVSDDEGRTTLFLPSQKKLRISIHADDHLAIEQRLPDSTAIVDFLLRPILAKADYRIESILFERSSTRILNSSYAALERLVLLLKSNPEQEILIQGHTDNVGTVNALKQLSRKRIDSVRRYLVTEGIDPGRISGEAFGGLKPKVQNIDEESRQKNRRVEVILR